MAEKEKIQEVPDGWQKTELGNTLMLIRNGFSGQQVQYTTKFSITRIETISDGYIDYQKVGYVKDIPFSYLLKIGDILISNINSIKHIGKIAIYRGLQPLYHGMNLLILRVNQDNDSLFLYYVLLSKKSWFEKVAAQAVNQASINQSTLRKCSLLIPLSIPEQRTIASVLSTCDEAIEKTDAKIEKLKSIKQGLMQDLFRYGIDENGKMRSKATHRFKDSPLGRIPEEWEVKTLEDVSEKIADRDHTTPKYIENGVPIVSPQDFDKNEKINFNNCAMISLKDHLINRKKTDIEFDDIVFTRIGAGLGKSCLVTKEMPEFSILHSAAMIRANKNRILPLYLLYSLKSFNLQKQIVDGIQSIGVPDLGMDKMKQLRLVMPINLTEQSRIASVLSAADEAIEKEEAYKNKLFAIKRGLMDDLLSGKVRVNKLIKEAA